jgi:glutamate 5-kinase
VKALKSGKSLLPAGVTTVKGAFSRGDAVKVLGPEGAVIGRGLIAYDMEEAQLIAGRNSREIEAIVGYPGRAEMIHRDDLVLEDGFLNGTS